MYTNNGSIRDLKSNQAIDTYELLYKMVDERLISRDCVNWTRMDLIRKFVSREVAMIIVDSSMMALFTQLSPSFPWTITSIPGDDLKTSLFITNNIVISTEANQEDVYKFLSFTLSKLQVKKRMESLGTLTIRNDVKNLFEETHKSTEVFCDVF